MFYNAVKCWNVKKIKEKTMKDHEKIDGANKEPQFKSTHSFSLFLGTCRFEKNRTAQN